MISNGPVNLIGLIGLSKAALAEVMTGMGEKPFRAKQLWHWIYERGENDFAAMTPLGKSLREALRVGYSLARPEISRHQISRDGARKWLLRFADGNEAETVYIPEDDRGALCLSTQVGCTMTCAFCHTGTQLLVRDLTAAEIVAQVMVARDACGEWPSQKAGRMISNIVVMGMGEPLFNYDNVAAALKIIMADDGIGISRRRITLSTCGVAPMIRRCGEELGVNLAISLHAATDELRDKLVPINRKYPIAELLDACRDYPGAGNSRRITFEYILLKDVNCSAADARALVRLVKGLPAKFNLIPFNPWPGAPYEAPPPAQCAKFAKILNDAGYSAPIRVARGRDILAACGQLRSAGRRPAIKTRG